MPAGRSITGAVAEPANPRAAPVPGCVPLDRKPPLGQGVGDAPMFDSIPSHSGRSQSIEQQVETHG